MSITDRSTYVIPKWRIMGIVQQTKYLVLKNFHIKKRNKRETLQEILIPIWLIVMLAIVKRRLLTELKPAVRENEIPTAKISSMGLAGLPGIASSKPNIGYVTNNLANAGSVMEIVRNTSKDSAKYVEFNTTDSLIAFYMEHTNLLVGIEFWNGKEKGLAYTLRVPRGRLPLPKNRLVGEYSYTYVHYGIAPTEKRPTGKCK